MKYRSSPYFCHSIKEMFVFLHVSPSSGSLSHTSFIYSYSHMSCAKYDFVTLIFFHLTHLKFLSCCYSLQNNISEFKAISPSTHILGFGEQIHVCGFTAVIKALFHFFCPCVIAVCLPPPLL